MSAPIIDVVRERHRHASNLAQAGVRLMAAIEQGDDERVLHEVHRVRMLRASLLRESAMWPDSDTTSEDPTQLLADLARLSPQVHAAEGALGRWLKRPLPSDDEMMRTEAGCVFLADAMLPSTWNYEDDVVVLFGGDMDPLATALRGLGQHRIVTYDPNFCGDLRPDTNVVVTTSQALRERLMAMGPHFPERYVGRRRAAGCVSAEDMKALSRDILATLTDLRADRDSAVTSAFSMVVEAAHRSTTGLTAGPAECPGNDFYHDAMGFYRRWYQRGVATVPEKAPDVIDRISEQLQLLADCRGVAEHYLAHITRNRETLSMRIDCFERELRDSSVDYLMDLSLPWMESARSLAFSGVSIDDAVNASCAFFSVVVERIDWLTRELSAANRVLSSRFSARVAS